MQQYFYLNTWDLAKLRDRLQKKYGLLPKKYEALEEAIKDEEPLDENSLYKQIEAISCQITEIEAEIFSRLEK